MGTASSGEGTAEFQCCDSGWELLLETRLLLAIMCWLYLQAGKAKPLKAPKKGPKEVSPCQHLPCLLDPWLPVWAQSVAAPPGKAHHEQHMTLH
jgi:hypothetical protein